MPLRLYNSLTRRTETLKPRTPGKIDLFVCGPTVYDLIHAGNARTFTVFDVVARWLRARGYEVTYIQNITDIDDKILRRAAEAQEPPLEYARRFEQEFLDDMAALGNAAVSQYARATDHIPQVIEQVKTLIAKGNVYFIEQDGWYFDLTTFPDYGKLSGRTGTQADDAVSRIDDSDKKRNRGDFCVWKLSKPGEPLWEDAQLGAGRPGWHIEDTAITQHYFGPQYDIHGGGMDLKFPHHEAEIAQQEAASGLVPFVSYWMHAGFLQINAQRMGKSVGNFETLRSLMGRYDIAVVRFFLLSGHYRAPLEYADTHLTAAAAAVQRIAELLTKISIVIPTPSSVLHDAVQAARERIEASMDDDFNTPAAFGALFDFIRTANTAIATSGISADDIADTRALFSWISDLFGIVPPGGETLPVDVQQLIDERQAAREQKDWVVADQLRDRLSELGWSIDDTPYGPLLRKT